MPERHRPHYAPEQRFRILRIRSFLGLSQRETAAMFRVSTETIARWEMEATGADGRERDVWSRDVQGRSRLRCVLAHAAVSTGHPAHFVSDRGACFTGGVFRRKLRRLGVKQRFGAIGKKGSIALIERFWRTLKDTLGLRLLRPSVAEDLLEKIEVGLVHYAHLRPHQGLGGATPAEIYFGRTPSHLFAIPPPRGRPGESPMDSPFQIEYLDAERLLPVLVRKAA